MEPLTQMMKSFMDMQQKTMNFWAENIQSMDKVNQNSKVVIENTIKFHKAAVDYHNSIVQMMESIRDTAEVLTPKV
jgi:hypothetical protein